MPPDDISADDLDSGVRAELLSLARPVAETVARHLVTTARLLDDEPELALAHALEARRLASRIGVVREAVGLAAYHAGQWQTAISELRTYHRLSGRQTHLAVVADCERALGRPERAVDLYRGADPRQLGSVEALELLIVAAGARGDLGQRDAAVAMLQVQELTAGEPDQSSPRLRYAYADALLAAGRRDEAREWFARAAEIDEDGITDAAERLLDLDGVQLDEDDADDADAEVEFEAGEELDDLHNIDGETQVDGEDSGPGDGAAGAGSGPEVPENIAEIGTRSMVTDPVASVPDGAEDPADPGRSEGPSDDDRGDDDRGGDGPSDDDRGGDGPSDDDRGDDGPSDDGNAVGGPDGVEAAPDERPADRP